MGKVIGIDLGTTCSVMAITEGRQTRVLVNHEGARLTPSVVAFTDDGTRLVGRPAKSQAALNPARTIYSVKRLIGRRRNEVTHEEKVLPYKLVGEPDELVQIEVDGRRYFPTEISAMVLQDLKKSAEKILGEPVNQCVVTVPAYFCDSARQATREACEISGLKVLRIINEPTAAALAYGLDSTKNEKILVADVGGGTADFTLLHVSEGVFDVIATAGDLFLGGDDLDRALMNYVADEFQKSSGVDVRKDPMALGRLTEACEKAKCDLSSVPQTTISLPYITASNGVPKHLTQTITRPKFEQVCEPVFERLRVPIMQALSDARMAPAEVQQVVLVGGTSRCPKIVEICKEIFNRQPHQGVNPDEAIAIGASIQCGVLSGDITDIVLLDVTPLTLGLETLGGICTPVIARNTTIPTSKTEVFSTASDNQPAVDIHVLQGERKMASANRTLGRFQMTGIPLQARGKPQIEVTFDIDANGILNVSSKDKFTGKEHKVEIKGSSGLDKADIDRMMRDAAQFEATDKAQAELIETRNRADNLAYETEKFMRENTKLISAAAHASVKAAVDALRAGLDSNVERSKIESLRDGLEVANKNMYEQCFGGKKPDSKLSDVQGAVQGETIEAKFEINP